jgi:L-methionine (R)-S-oxide reductase
MTRQLRLASVAEAICSVGGYRWVGIYDVTATQVRIIAYSGPGAPAFPVFPADKGLTSEAIRSRATVIVGNVAADPHYLTAFGTTQSEMIVPILDAASGVVIGTIDVESEKPDAFAAEDRARIEQLAAELAPSFR